MIFKNRICRLIKKLNTTIPVDEALQGIGITKAITIDVNESVRRISATDRNLKTINFNEFYDVAPPVAGSNWFIQFSSKNISNDMYEPGWIGVHCVDFQIARKSKLYQRTVDSLAQIANFPLVLSFIVYREMSQGLSVSQAGILLGIEPGGRVSEPGFVTMPGAAPVDGVRWKYVIGVDAWVLYLVLNSFAMVNQREARMHFENEVYIIT